MMDRSLKALSLLLTYPSTELQAAMPEITALLVADSRLTAVVRRQLAALCGGLAEGDIYDLQETYVGLFDRSRSLSLNLFEHVHGESRDRGSAMVDLLETYRAGGFEPVTGELPDHLPVLLEFLAAQPAAEARAILTDAAPVLAVLQRRLSGRESPYAAVFAALEALSGTAAAAETVEALMAAPEDDPQDLATLDAVWEETQVTFGPDPNAGCPQVRDMLSRMDQPARPAEAGAAG